MKASLFFLFFYFFIFRAPHVNVTSLYIHIFTSGIQSKTTRIAGRDAVCFSHYFFSLFVSGRQRRSVRILFAKIVYSESRSMMSS